MNELKPCPFCGGVPKQKQQLRDGYKNWKESPDAVAYFIVCHTCSAHGGWATYKEGAIKLWNQRAYDFDMPAIVRQVEYLKDVVHALKIENSKLIELVYGDGERDTDSHSVEQLQNALLRCKHAIDYACDYHLEFSQGAEVLAFINGYTGEEDLLPLLAQLEEQCKQRS